VSHAADDVDFDEAGPPAAHPFERLTRLLAALGTVWIFMLMFLVVADVVGRNFLDKPITGVPEFAGRSVVAIVFLQLAAAITAGKMTRSDFLMRIIGKRSPGTVRTLDVLNALIGCALFVALAVISWPEAVSAWVSNDYFGVQGVATVPSWPFRGLLVVGSVMAALAYLSTIPALLRGSARAREQAHG
jgi:TRAP-type C4-dicarboxylate transport system permease small subunit